MSDNLMLLEIVGFVFFCMLAVEVYRAGYEFGSDGIDHDDE